MPVLSKKRDHQKVVGWFALFGLIVSVKGSLLPLWTPLGLWVIAIDPTFIAGHQTKNCGIWIDQLDHLPAVKTTSFFLIFSEQPWDKLSVNLPNLLFLVNNCVYSSHTDIKLSTYCPHRHTAVLIHEILWGAMNSGVVTPILLQHHSSSFTDSRPSLNPACHSKNDVRLIPYGPKEVWSIPYFSVAFFQA